MPDLAVDRLRVRAALDRGTDDRGRFVLPDLPKANYNVWVRGYGLIDSPKVVGMPGASLNLTALVAPTPQAAAQYYPPNYWLSLMKLPEGPEQARAGAAGRRRPGRTARKGGRSIRSGWGRTCRSPIPRTRMPWSRGCAMHSSG